MATPAETGFAQNFAAFRSSGYFSSWYGFAQDIVGQGFSRPRSAPLPARSGKRRTATRRGHTGCRLKVKSQSL